MSETVSIRVSQSGAGAVADSMREIEAATRSVNGAFAAAAPAVDMLNTELDELGSQHIDGLTKAIEQLTMATDDARDSMDELQRSGGKVGGGKATVAVAEQKSALAKLATTVTRSIALWGAYKFAVNANTRGIVSAVRNMSKQVGFEVRIIRKALKLLGFTAIAARIRRMEAVAQLSFRRLSRGVQALQQIWTASFMRMMGSSSIAVRTFALLLGTMGTAIRQEFEQLGRSLPVFMVSTIRIMGRFGAAMAEKMAAPLQRFTQSMASFRASAAKTISRLRLMGAAVAALGALLITGLIATALIKLGASGAKLVPVQRAFENLSEVVGSTSDLMTTDLKNATLNTVSSIDLMKNSVLALNSGAIKTRAELSQVARAAQVLGQTVGISTAEAFGNLIRGIGLINPQLIKSVGVLVSAEDAYRKYAVAINKTVGELDDHERKEAFRLEVMEKLHGAVSRVNAQQVSLTNSLQQLGAAATNWLNTTRSQIASSQRLIGFVDMLSGSFVALSNFMEKNSKVVQGLTDSFFWLTQRMLDLVPVFGALGIYARKMTEIKKVNAAFVSSSQDLGKAMAFIRDQSNRGIVSNADLLKIGVMSSRVRELQEALLEERTPESIAALAAAQIQLGNLLDNTIRLKEASLEVVELWRDGFGAVVLDVSTLAPFSEGLEGAKNAIIEAKVEASLLRAQWDATADPETRNLLIAGIEGARTKLAEATMQAEFFGSSLKDTLIIVTQMAGAIDHQIEAQLQQKPFMDQLAEAAALRLTFEEDTVQALMRQARALAEVRTERQRLNALLPKPEQFLSGRASDALAGFQQAGISPADAAFETSQQLLRSLTGTLTDLQEQLAGGGGDAEMQQGLRTRIHELEQALQRVTELPSLRQALLDLGELTTVQAQWSQLLSGNADALQRLVEMEVLTQQEADELAESLGNLSSKTEIASAQIVTALGGALISLVNGTQDAAAAIIQTASQVAQISLIAGGNVLGGALVGVAGGLLGALFGGRKERPKVEIDKFSSEALRQQERVQSGPSTVTIQLIDPSTGRVTSETVEQLNRLERRDAVRRFEGSTV